LFPWICALTVFASALLVFQVQPIIGKMLLPWFGGSSAVWTACLLFFQVMLLAGYTYAHLLANFRTPRAQVIIHALLAAAALALLPITPSDGWKPTGREEPTLRLLLLLTATVGAPYFLLSATAPLVQHWFGLLLPGRSPYRLYALSNVASLAALLSYPLAVEPLFSSPVQGSLWSAGFAAYAVLLGVMLVVVWRIPFAFDDLRAGTEMRREQDSSSSGESTSGDAKERVHKSKETKGEGQATSLSYATLPQGVRYAAWILLPALAVVLLMAVTSHVCQDVPAVPFLYVVPLSIYLLTFIICFDSPRWYARSVFAMAGVLAVLAVSVNPASFDLMLARLGIESSIEDAAQSVLGQLVRYFILLFLLAMLCHGELVRLKPPPRQLTAFYLCVSGGGALGGLLVALVCPLVFDTYLELPLAMLLALVLAVAVLLDDMRTTLSRWHWVLGGVVVCGAAYLILGSHVFRGDDSTLVRVRNAFGTLRVTEFNDAGFARRSLGGVAEVTNGEEEETNGKEGAAEFVHERARMLYHGNIEHGVQFLDKPKRYLPTSYYSLVSGVGRAIISLPPDRPHRIGVIGLGTGTLAAYGHAGDFICFYEINPAVVELADEHFTYLRDSPAEQEFVLGDARLSLEREPPRRYDVLAVDAFSGDSIPVHLLTAEALAVYRRHMAPDGIIAVHISNRYLDLAPVVTCAARAQGMEVRRVEVLIADEEHPDQGYSESDWLLLADDPQVFEREAFRIRPGAKELPAYENFRPWTDSYSNILGILR
jgi:SAM-dependent methyltransferase